MLARGLRVDPLETLVAASMYGFNALSNAATFFLPSSIVWLVPQNENETSPTFEPSKWSVIRTIVVLAVDR